MADAEQLDVVAAGQDRLTRFKGTCGQHNCPAAAPLRPTATRDSREAVPAATTARTMTNAPAERGNSRTSAEAPA